MAKSTMRRIAARDPLRKAFNRVYNRLPPGLHGEFERRFAKIFRGEGYANVAPGTWFVAFAERSIVLPLQPERFWLDWDLALSIVGHDAEVKQTYAKMLCSRYAPDLFVDIGGNYGYHSLLFLAHSIETITFEPNLTCHPLFREVCAMNGLRPRIEAVALSDHTGMAELRFPEGETWQGSIFPVESTTTVVSQPTALRTLDSYLPETERRKRILIKIDAEGAEAAILRGAASFLRKHRPTIIFEALPVPARRAELSDVLTQAAYEIASLPWSPCSPARPISMEQFHAETATNFLAIPHSAGDKSTPAIPPK